MLRAAARIFVSRWLLGGLCRRAAEPAQPAPGALEITLKAGETPGAAREKIKLYSASKALVIGIDNYSGRWPEAQRCDQGSRRPSRRR